VTTHLDVLALSCADPHRRSTGKRPRRSLKHAGAVWVEGAGTGEDREPSKGSAYKCNEPWEQRVPDLRGKKSSNVKSQYDCPTLATKTNKWEEWDRSFFNRRTCEADNERSPPGFH